jgi:hypothetical protein
MTTSVSEEAPLEAPVCSVEWFASEQQAMLSDLESSSERIARLLNATATAAIDDSNVRELVTALRERCAELEHHLERVQEDLDAAVRMVVGLRADVTWDAGFNYRRDFAFRFHDGDHARSLTICQRPVGGSVGFVAWAAAFVLCNVLIERYGVCGRNRNNGVAVELGCGTALVGLVAACLGFRVTVTDKADTLSIAHKNVRENPTVDGVQVVELPWGDSGAVRGVPTDVDLVLGSELLATHDGDVFKQLRDTVLAIATAPKTECLFVFEERNCNEASFFDLLRPHFETVEELKRTKFNPSSSSWIRLLRVAGRRI